MPPSPPSDQIGRVLGGRYRLITPVGRGASAEVYLADDATLRRRVAVKMLHPALSDDPVFLRRFRAEAQAAAALNHPHVMSVYDWGHDEVPYLVTEYLGGGSLRAMLDAGHLLTPSQALLIGLEATRGLEYAHKRGLVHRDIKPANLLFDDEGRLRIADFGIARALAEAAWTEPTGAVVGTARYASPEQARGESLDGKSDVYAVALVLIEAVTGTVPFTADTTLGTLNARVGKQLPVSDQLGPLRKAIERAGHPDVDERPDAGEFSVALMAAAEELSRPEPLPLVSTLAAEPGTGNGAVDPTLVGAVPAVDAATSADATGADEPPDDDRIPLDDEPTSGERRRRWPWALLAALVVASLAGGGVALWLANRTPTHEVPELRDVPYNTALAMIADLGWELLDDPNSLRDDVIEAGRVISTDPPAGTDLAEGETLVITVSSGPNKRAAPSVDEVYDIPAIDVELLIDQAGLAVGEQIEVFDEEVDAGNVVGLQVGSDPAEGVAFEPNTPIDLIVSAGPAERLVPEVAGLTFAEATAVLNEARLVAVEGTGRSNDVDAGEAIGTDPPLGTPVPADSEVTVIVSEGRPLVEVPNLIGESFADADELLRSLGFRVRLVDGLTDGLVAKQVPLPNEPAEEGSIVEIETT